MFVLSNEIKNRSQMRPVEDFHLPIDFYFNIPKLITSRPGSQIIYVQHLMPIDKLLWICIVCIV